MVLDTNNIDEQIEKLEVEMQGPDFLIGEEFAVSRFTITRLRKKHDLPRCQHEKGMTNPKYRKWYEDMVVKRDATLARRRLEDSKSTRIVLEYKNYLSGKCKKQRCSVCGNTYSKTAEFFRQYKVMLPNGSVEYTPSSVCIACPVKGKKKAEFMKRQKN